MKRATRMCESCPFRIYLNTAEKRELAAIHPEEFPCHTEAGYYSHSDIQCRGHWGVRRKYAPSNELESPTP
jgi:hypothetical protein